MSGGHREFQGGAEAVVPVPDRLFSTARSRRGPALRRTARSAAPRPAGSLSRAGEGIDTDGTVATRLVAIAVIAI
ncbi:hypothetical protein [Actinoplanes missouriensis]|uniref:hypothetical protein n=1 Tax=Actinoplanes missouriensis TaxID=1866 RepID=UPI0005A265E4|nr:hypothetical protein [Actinoplanes missouriensis]